MPQFGIIGYGKLGGKELGYGSDLDIVFVFDDDDERAPEVYAAFVRKLINWLTVKTGEGDLYEIDTALRPNGNSGLLVTSFEAYANYQQQRGSNTAWTWEHQAMTRARFVAGQPRACTAASMPCAKPSSPPPATPARCKEEIVTMRERVRSAHPVPSRPASRSSTARAAWSMPSLPCSTWCCRNLAPTPSCAATWATSPCWNGPSRWACCPPAWATPPPTPTRELRRVQHRGPPGRGAHPGHPPRTADRARCRAGAVDRGLRSAAASA